MIEALKRICELQPQYSSKNTPAMQERGKLVRHDIVDAIRELAPELSDALGRFGDDFSVQGRDGTGPKVSNPWVRFHSRSMSPSPRQGFYSVLHFSTDGSAVHVTVGCGSSKYENGSFSALPNKELDAKTRWMKKVVADAQGTIEPFSDEPDFGAVLPLPRSFQRATALCNTIRVEDLQEDDFRERLVEAAACLRIIYEAQAAGQDLVPADYDEVLMTKAISPRKATFGQHYGLNADDKRKVEMRAMELARGWLETSGFKAKDVSSRSSFDFEAWKGSELTKVEVKGTTSDTANPILMTRNEVDLHRLEAGRTCLILVSGIRLIESGSDRKATGGEVEVLMGWNIDEWELIPTAYRVSRASKSKDVESPEF